MLGWLGALAGAGAAFIGGFYTGGLSWKLIPLCLSGMTIGGATGYVGQFAMDTTRSQLAKQDKQLAKEIEAAKTEGEKALVAQKALDHQNGLLNTLSEQVKKNSAEMEDLQKIFKGEKKLPDGKTMEDVKNEYAKKEQENAALFDQIKKSQVTSELLQQFLAKPNSWNLPSLTFKNVGWGIGLVLVGLLLVIIAVKAIKKWIGSLL